MPCLEVRHRAALHPALPPKSPTNPRSPDDANVRNKMVYASSKDALHRRLEGIHIDLQATDYSEITKEASECFSGLGSSLASWARLGCAS